MNTEQTSSSGFISFGGYYKHEGPNDPLCESKRKWLTQTKRRILRGTNRMWRKTLNLTSVKILHYHKTQVIKYHCMGDKDFQYISEFELNRKGFRYIEEENLAAENKRRDQFFKFQRRPSHRNRYYSWAKKMFSCRICHGLGCDFCPDDDEREHQIYMGAQECILCLKRGHSSNVKCNFILRFAFITKKYISKIFP